MLAPTAKQCPASIRVCFAFYALNTLMGRSEQHEISAEKAKKWTLTSRPGQPQTPVLISAQSLCQFKTDFAHFAWFFICGPGSLRSFLWTKFHCYINNQGIIWESNYFLLTTQDAFSCVAEHDPRKRQQRRRKRRKSWQRLLRQEIMVHCCAPSLFLTLSRHPIMEKCQSIFMAESSSSWLQSNSDSSYPNRSCGLSGAMAM